ncbi:MAG: molecular chaperone TorD family protein [Dehalococcoidia bacterium]
MAQIEDLKTTDELQAAARSRLYQLLARAFSLPTRTLHRRLAHGSFASEVADNAASLPYPLAIDTDMALTEAGSSYQELQGEYIRLFDVGVPRPPCPLYGGEYQKARMAVMEELIRFYNHFGLRPSGRSRELPDHITAELEFMHFLTFKEVAALHQGQPRDSYLRAERDFLERHLCAWVPLLGQCLRRHHPHPFYTALTRLVEDFLACERDYLEDLLQGGDNP